MHFSPRDKDGGSQDELTCRILQRFERDSARLLVRNQLSKHSRSHRWSRWCWAELWNHDGELVSDHTDQQPSVE